MLPFGLIVTLALAADPSVNAEWLISKNEEALGRIHSLRATLEARGSMDGGTTWTAMQTMRLVKSGSRERVRLVMKASPVGDAIVARAANFQDWLNTPEGAWGLDGMDVDYPPKGSVVYIDNEITGKGTRSRGASPTPTPRGLTATTARPPR